MFDQFSDHLWPGIERPQSGAFLPGKTITVVQIVGAGGTGDTRRRALFPFLQKYIPGNPTIVSDYMPGGGGRKAANHIYRIAKPDGLTIGGMSASLVINAILDTVGVSYDLDKLIYLGSPVSIFHYIFLTWKEAGLNTLDKLRAASGVRIGGQEVGHDVYISARVFAYLMALKEPKFVLGYGGPEMDIALERGEIDARAASSETLTTRNAKWIEKKQVDLHAIVEVPKGNRPGGFARLQELEEFAPQTANASSSACIERFVWSVRLMSSLLEHPKPRYKFFAMRRKRPTRIPSSTKNLRSYRVSKHRRSCRKKWRRR